MAAKKQSVVISEDDAKAIEQAIAQGQALIAQGKTKVDASMAIYRALNTQPQETVVSEMIEGGRPDTQGRVDVLVQLPPKIRQGSGRLIGPIEGNSVDYIETPKYPGCYPRLGEIGMGRPQSFKLKSKQA
ncbi:hypothetical protein A33O_05105 [Nitratireductor aquibiodomus RA22]|uniref:Uncharacterized protein n=1 Tax=Nitratireductor aquibiodomus RA22 TaxID=1189611 RepID=I5C3X4_9HYPH|nr:hypothetical protein [Nitratireductor aquibiodomus]EIM76526.1 hypothetical protein A33O_05105 [Nitratireductor aquibiodomus RA22]